MWTLFSTLTWEKGAENWSVECWLIFTIVIVIVIVVVVIVIYNGYFIIVVVIEDDTYYWVSLSSDNPFQVHYIRYDSLLLHCVMVCHYKLLHLFKKCDKYYKVRPRLLQGATEHTALKAKSESNNYRGGSRSFFRRGCTRLLLYFNTNKPHSFLFFFAE